MTGSKTRARETWRRLGKLRTELKLRLGMRGLRASEAGCMLFT